MIVEYKRRRNFEFLAFVKLRNKVEYQEFGGSEGFYIEQSEWFVRQSEGIIFGAVLRVFQRVILKRVEFLRGISTFFYDTTKLRIFAVHNASRAYDKNQDRPKTKISGRGRRDVSEQNVITDHVIHTTKRHRK